MRRWAYIVVAVLAELLSWPPLVLGFVVGVVVGAVLLGYGYGLAAVMPARTQPLIEEDEDD